MFAYAIDFMNLLLLALACWIAHQNWYKLRAEKAETKRLLSELDKMGTEPNKD